VRTAIALLTRDLRVHDNPVLATALRAAGTALPLFVVDPAIRAGANRLRFLAESLADLRESR
jgi:deoxyribodipyrimidine photo-lyase